MLTFNRKTGEAFIINGNIIVKVEGIFSPQAFVTVGGPANIRIDGPGIIRPRQLAGLGFESRQSHFALWPYSGFQLDADRGFTAYVFYLNQHGAKSAKFGVIAPSHVKILRAELQDFDGQDGYVICSQCQRNYVWAAAGERCDSCLKSPLPAV